MSPDPVEAAAGGAVRPHPKYFLSRAERTLALFILLIFNCAVGAPLAKPAPRSTTVAADILPARAGGILPPGASSTSAESLPAAGVLIGTARSTNGLELSWTDLGPDWAYTVEYSDSVDREAWLACPPTNQWPIVANHWTDVRMPLAPVRFYRVLAQAVPIERGKVLSASLSRSMSADEISELIRRYGIPLVAQKGVTIYKVVYETVDPFNGRIRASGALVIPQNPGQAVPLVSYQHGTILVRSEVPSAVGSEVLVGVAFGTTGYAAALPDYLGLGDSPGLHPYHHARSEATAVVDLLRAARIFCAANSIALNPQLFLCGYSQGGHATMAAHRAIEADYSTEFTLTASAPMAGAYDMSGVTTTDFLSDRSMPNPYYFIYLLAAYQGVYHFASSLTDILSEPYATTLPPLLDGQHDGSQINPLMRAVPKQILKPEYLQAFQTNPEHPLRIALRDNDLYNWTPRAPLHLYHVHGDRDVLYANSQTAYDTFIRNGATQVQLIDPFPLGDHSSGFLFCLVQAKAWFDSLKR